MLLLIWGYIYFLGIIFSSFFEKITFTNREFSVKNKYVITWVSKRYFDR